MELRILGALEVEEDGRVVRIAGAKQRTLLALLLLHANEPVPRDRLIEELWGVKQPQTAATALQVHVSQLRKALGRDLIVTRAPGCLIRVADGELDLECFEQTVVRARTSAPGEAAALLRGGARPVARCAVRRDRRSVCARRARPPRGAAAASCRSRRPFAAQLALMAWSCSRV
jgi:DNA-binding SARP family transcriptional activator